MLREACRQTAAWHGQGLNDLTVSVNLCARQFQDHDLIATVKRVLAETGLAAANLDLEITESTVIRDLEAAERVLHELRGLGVRLSLDDFGTGYASMAHLKRLPFSELKIDRQFVRDLEIPQTLPSPPERQARRGPLPGRAHESGTTPSRGLALPPQLCSFRPVHTRRPSASHSSTAEFGL